MKININHPTNYHVSNIFQGLRIKKILTCIF